MHTSMCVRVLYVCVREKACISGKLSGVNATTKCAIPSGTIKKSTSSSCRPNYSNRYLLL